MYKLTFQFTSETPCISCLPIHRRTSDQLRSPLPRAAINELWSPMITACSSADLKPCEKKIICFFPAGYDLQIRRSWLGTCVRWGRAYVRVEWSGPSPSFIWRLIVFCGCFSDRRSSSVRGYGRGKSRGLSSKIEGTWRGRGKDGDGFFQAVLSLKMATDSGGMWESEKLDHHEQLMR